MSSATESEFNEFDTNRVWNEVYQRLKNEASLNTMGDDYSVSCARDPENRKKNRYRDVSPYDHSRVELSDEKYINASRIQVPEANRNYILTQGPLEHTMGDFWQMAWEQKSRAIVMLNRVIEKGTLKCSQYWPINGTDDEMYFPECGIRVTLGKDQDFQHFTLRSLDLENMETGERREVFHFHYTTWPDFGVPSSPNAFLHFLHAVRQTDSLGSDVGPTIVHCSAGIGRSGTFCLVDSCLVMVEQKGSLDCINVRESLIKLRSYRMGLIQTADQLRFSYLAIIQGAHSILSGEGLASLEAGSTHNTMNHMEGPPPPPPERTSSLQDKNHQDALMDLIDDMDLVPPPLPPKIGRTETEGQRAGPSDEESDEDYDEIIDREEEAIDSSSESEDEASAALVRQKIRDERKLETMEKIRKMKERQRQNERWKEYRSYVKPGIYFGLALLVGVAGVVVYKYFV